MFISLAMMATTLTYFGRSDEITTLHCFSTRKEINAMKLTLSTIGAFLVFALVGFMLGQQFAQHDSPCITSWEQDGRTYCLMTEVAAARERR